VAIDRKKGEEAEIPGRKSSAKRESVGRDFTRGRGESFLRYSSPLKRSEDRWGRNSSREEEA